jgi:hypothetical protein
VSSCVGAIYCGTKQVFLPGRHDCALSNVPASEEAPGVPLLAHSLLARLWVFLLVAMAQAASSAALTAHHMQLSAC